MSGNKPKPKAKVDVKATRTSKPVQRPKTLAKVNTPVANDDKVRELMYKMMDKSLKASSEHLAKKVPKSIVTKVPKILKKFGKPFLDTMRQYYYPEKQQPMRLEAPYAPYTVPFTDIRVELVNIDADGTLPAMFCLGMTNPQYNMMFINGKPASGACDISNAGFPGKTPLSSNMITIDSETAWSDAAIGVTPAPYVNVALAENNISVPTRAFYSKWRMNGIKMKITPLGIPLENDMTIVGGYIPALQWADDAFSPFTDAEDYWMFRNLAELPGRVVMTGAQFVQAGGLELHGFKDDALASTFVEAADYSFEYPTLDKKKTPAPAANKTNKKRIHSNLKLTQTDMYNYSQGWMVPFIAVRSPNLANCYLNIKVTRTGEGILDAASNTPGDLIAPFQVNNGPIIRQQHDVVAQAAIKQVPTTVPGPPGGEEGTLYKIISAVDKSLDIAGGIINSPIGEAGGALLAEMLGGIVIA